MLKTFQLKKVTKKECISKPFNTGFKFSVNAKIRKILVKTISLSYS